MIKIVAENYVTKENVQAFLDLVAELVRESRKEAGCISYSLFEDCSDPTHLTFIEEWKDEDAIAIHNATSHFTELVPEMGKLCCKEGAVKKYTEVNFDQ